MGYSTPYLIHESNDAFRFEEGSPALSMKSADFRPGTTENSLEKEDRCAGWRPRIIESAGEPLLSRNTRGPQY